MADSFGYLVEMGCRKSGRAFILDGFSPDFYLIFGVENSGELGTVDVFVAHPEEPNQRGRIMLRSGCHRQHVMRILAAVGVSQFDERVKRVFYNFTNPLR